MEQTITLTFDRELLQSHVYRQYTHRKEFASIYSSSSHALDRTANSLFGKQSLSDISHLSYYALFIHVSEILSISDVFTFGVRDDDGKTLLASGVRTNQSPGDAVLNPRGCRLVAERTIFRYVLSIVSILRKRETWPESYNRGFDFPVEIAEKPGSIDNATVKALKEAAEMLRKAFEVDLSSRH